MDGTNSGVSFEFVGVSDNSKSKVGTYVLENNQKIAYKITVSKDLLKDGEQVLSILTPSNVIIESSLVPLEKKICITDNNS